MQLINKKVHFIGIKGFGLSAVAQYFFWAGARITGSDGKEEFPTDAVLKRLKIPVKLFSPENIKPGLDLVIYSSAYNENHPEIKKAVQLKIPLKSYGEVLAGIFNNGKNKIVVAGSHGKTTTTALLGHLLDVAGYKPTVFVGGIVNNWQSNFKKGLPAGRQGNNNWLVAEGDEYQKKFLFLKPDYLLITNIDFDHPDCFKNKKEYREAFEELKKQTKKNIFSGQKISPIFRKFLAKIDFPLLGEKNKENAYLVYRLAKELKISDKKIKTAFETFKGVKRRMEIIKELKIIKTCAVALKNIPQALKDWFPTAVGISAPREKTCLPAGRNSRPLESEYSGSERQWRKSQIVNCKLKIIDDYAHHPEEIKATLSALKEKYPDYKILAIFQPHTFSRTKSLMTDFGKCFQKADFVYLLPTFASAREQKPKENIDELLLKEVGKYHRNAKSLPFNFKSLSSEINELLNSLASRDLAKPDKSRVLNSFIIITIGAGDVYKLTEKLNLI